MIWSAHLGALFTELPMLHRFSAAASAGFHHVELWSPFDLDLDELFGRAADAGVRVVGFNLDAGDMPSGDRGFLNLPDRREAVLENAWQAVALATRLGARNVNALVGNAVDGESREGQLERVGEVLDAACEIFSGSGVSLMAEPLNPEENPRYLLHSATEAAELVSSVNRPELGLLYDAYHAARSGNDPRSELLRHRAILRHVQIADVPGRHEPGTGTLDLPAIIDTLAEIGYDGAIGLEYFPTGDTEESLAWLDQELLGRAGSAGEPHRAQRERLAE